MTQAISNWLLIKPNQLLQRMKIQLAALATALRPYSTYNFSVAAATGVGTGPFSTVITVNTPEAGMS